jgi:hypothetical protein
LNFNRLRISFASLADGMIIGLEGFITKMEVGWADALQRH